MKGNLPISTVFLNPAQQMRFDALASSAQEIFMDFLATIQDAEEMGGPEGQAYLDLMQAIIDEATERRCTCRAILHGSDEYQ